METLLEGDSVEVSIDEQLVFEQLDNDENAIGVFCLPAVI